MSRIQIRVRFFNMRDPRTRIRSKWDRIRNAGYKSLDDEDKTLSKHHFLDIECQFLLFDGKNMIIYYFLAFFGRFYFNKVQNTCYEPKTAPKILKLTLNLPFPPPGA